MTQYESQEPTIGCMFPKPRRKSSRGKWAKSIKMVDGKPTIVPDHNSVMETVHSELTAKRIKFLHIPDVLYRLIAPPIPNKRTGTFDPLSFALEEAVGKGVALGIKREIAEAIKGWPDTVAVVPLSRGICLALLEDIKTGTGKLNAAQRRMKRDAGMVESHSTSESMEHITEFLALADRIRKEIFESS